MKKRRVFHASGINIRSTLTIKKSKEGYFFTLSIRLTSSDRWAARVAREVSSLAELRERTVTSIALLAACLGQQPGANECLDDYLYQLTQEAISELD